MSGNNGEQQKKKSLPKFDDKWKDAYLHTCLKIIEHLTGQDARICIKLEALENFPDYEKPLFIWENSKEHWVMVNPKQEKLKLALPKRTVIDPSK